MLYKSFDTFIFDYDGTLIDSKPHAYHVFKIVGQRCVELGYIDTVWSDDTITQIIGHNPLRAWQVLLPHISEEKRLSISAYYSETMFEHLSNTLTTWYPQAYDVIKTLLLEGKHLILLTNARRYYVEIALKHHPILNEFDQVHCAQDFNYQSKSEITPQLSLKGKVMIVGDKLDDAQAAQSINASSVWAQYGYGNHEIDGKHFTFRIDSIENLLKIPSF
jgi:phosphoglycolate phosphatase-like HAD superfamily hydrolase